MRQHPRATGAGPISVHSDGEQRGLRSVHAPAGCRDPTPDSPCTFQSSQSSLGGRKPRPGGASCGGPRRQVRSHSASDACMTPQPRKRPSQRSCRDTRARADADQREPRRRRHVTVVNTSGWPRSATLGRRAQRSMVLRSDVCEVVRGWMSGQDPVATPVARYRLRKSESHLHSRGVSVVVQLDLWHQVLQRLISART
jgi:hypothetical protein